jgi:hypothetical protein
MPYGYNRYNEPGFAEGFNSTYDLTQRVLRDRGLADVEKEPGVVAVDGPLPAQADTNSPPGLADTGQNNDKSYGRDQVYNDGEAAPQGGAVDMGDGISQIQHVAGRRYKLGDQTYDQQPSLSDVSQYKASRRASVMRSTGAPEDANKEEQAAATLGLTDVQRRRGEQEIGTGALDQQLKGYEVKKAGRADVVGAGIEKARQATADYVNASQIDMTTVSGQTDAAQHHVQALMAAGLPEQAAAAARAFSEATSATIAATRMQRGEAATSLQQAMTANDPNMIAQALTRLDSFLPMPSGRVESVQIKGPGQYVINRVNVDGTRQSLPITSDKLTQMVDQMAGTEFDKQAQAMVESRLKQGLVKAQTNAADASAGASSASAKERGVATEQNQYTLDRQKLLDKAYGTPEAQRTPEQVALIKGYSDHVDDSRPYRSGNDHDRITFKQGLDGSTIATKNDGSMWKLPRTGKTAADWVQITPGGPVDGATPPAGGAPAAAASGATASAPVVKTAEDYAKLKKGDTYVDPQGKTRVKG